MYLLITPDAFSQISDVIVDVSYLIKLLVYEHKQNRGGDLWADDPWVLGDHSPN